MRTRSLLIMIILLLVGTLSALPSKELPEEWDMPSLPSPCALTPSDDPSGSVLLPAPLDVVPGGTAEWLVAPGVFNMPQTVRVNDRNELLVISGRSDTLFTLDVNGEIRSALGIGGGRALLGDDGSVYTMGAGPEILRLRPSGTIERFAEIDCSTRVGIEAISFAPDGAIHICLGSEAIYRAASDGSVSVLDAHLPFPIHVLYTAPDGTYYGARYDTVYRIAFPGYELTELCTIPQGHHLISEQALVVDDAGRLYIATGNRDDHGALYRYTEDAGVELLALIDGNGLSGIDWCAKTREIVGCQLVRGGLIGVHVDTGAVREIVAGNGLITPMLMDVSSCGSIGVICDDGGMLALVTPSGDVSRFFGYGAYVGPISQVVFDEFDRTYVTQGCAGFPSVVAVLDPAVGRLRRMAENLAVPSGLVQDDEGHLIVAECEAGRITKLLPDSRQTVLARELTFPQALAIDADGVIYAVCGGDESFAPWGPYAGEYVCRISTEGAVERWCELPGVMGLTIAPDGKLVASAYSCVYGVEADGEPTPLITGLTGACGVVYDEQGRLYVSDHTLNAVARITFQDKP